MRRSIAKSGLKLRFRDTIDNLLKTVLAAVPTDFHVNNMLMEENLVIKKAMLYNVRKHQY